MMRGTFFRSTDQRLLILLMDINNAATDMERAGKISNEYGLSLNVEQTLTEFVKCFTERLLPGLPNDSVS